jgi:hypothetical protein
MNLKKWIVLKIEQFRCNIAKKEANLRHSVDGKRYFVVKIGPSYVITNNEIRKRMNRRNPPHLRITFAEMMKNKVYCTK